MESTRNVTVTLATGDDLDALVSGNAAMARETEAKELDLAVLRRGVAAVLGSADKGFYLVARPGPSSEGGASGCIGQLMITFEWSDWRARPIWWIQSVYVLPEARRRGVYRALYAEVMRRAAEADVCAVRLYVERTNGRAKETYSALGMSPATPRSVPVLASTSSRMTRLTSEAWPSSRRFASALLRMYSAWRRCSI